MKNIRLEILPYIYTDNGLHNKSQHGKQGFVQQQIHHGTKLSIRLHIDTDRAFNKIVSESAIFLALRYEDVVLYW